MSEDLTERQEALLQIVAGLVPATAEEVATALGNLSVELHKTSVALTAADMAATELIEEHGRAYDREFLSAGFDPRDPTLRVTEKIREATAREKTWELRLRMEQAKREMRRLKRQLDTLDRRIFVGQSVAKTLRSEHRNIGYGPGA